MDCCCIIVLLGDSPKFQLWGIIQYIWFFTFYAGRSSLRRIYMDSWVLANGLAGGSRSERSKFGKSKSTNGAGKKCTADPVEWVQSGHRSHATANQKVIKSRETLSNKDASSCGCQPPPPWPPCLHNGSKNGVSMVAKLKDIHGPNDLDSHSPRLI